MPRNWIYWAIVILPTIAISILLQLAQAPASGSLRPKIFVLGLSKTGTTSIGDALERLGYRRLGWRDVRSRHMVHAWANGDVESLIHVTRYYDAFEDLPWPKVYRTMAEIYPDAKFILSLRSREEKWLRSMATHIGRGQWLPYTYFYDADTFEGNEDAILQSYRRHTAEVRAYFADKPNRYVEMNIDDGNANWEVLCSIARCPGDQAPDVEFPRSNTAASWDMDFLSSNINWYKGWVITRAEEIIAPYYYESRNTQLTPLLNVCWRLYDLVERAHTSLYFRFVSPLILPPVDIQSPQ